MLSSAGARVQSLDRGLRSHKLHSTAPKNVNHETSNCRERPKRPPCYFCACLGEILGPAPGPHLYQQHYGHG